MAEPNQDPEGCKHYRRNCEIKSPCCGRFFTCHNCHDEQMEVTDECRVEMKGSTEGMGRYNVAVIRCKVCNLEQDVGPVCAGCGVEFAEYFCKICKLFSKPTNQGIYHCNGCGICRVGQGIGISHFHCDTCKACYTLESRQGHKCVERALDSDCPVCMQYLFTSAKPLFVGPQCGHALHQTCFKEAGTFKCPTCSKPMFEDKVIKKIEKRNKTFDYALKAASIAVGLYLVWRFLA